MMTWQIRTMRPSPSMCETTATITGSYADACNAARDAYASTGRSSSVVRDAFYWFRVGDTGEVNRNLNAKTR